MDEIGFPKNFPDEFTICFVAAFNEINRLKEENNFLKRIAFSQRSEKYVKYEFMSPEGTLFNEAENLLNHEQNLILGNETTTPASAEKTLEINNHKNKNSKNNKKTNNILFPENNSSRRTFPAALPRETITHDLSDEEKICKYDNSTMVKIGEDIVEKLDVVPASMKVVQHRYLKYACKCCNQNIVQPKAAPSVIPGSIAESGLLAHVVTNKYLFALPLYRQEILFQQKNIEIPRVTLARWMMACADAVAPLVAEIKRYILSQPVIHCDETHVQVLSGTNKKPTSKSYMWVLASAKDAHPASVFQFYTDRSKSSASDFLEFYKGFLHVDGYDGYNQVCSQLSVTRVACWAHVRRKFESAFKDGAPAGKSLAELFLTEIQKLFLLEREIEPLSPLEKQNMRFEKASPIIQNIRKLIDENVNKVLPRSKLGNAFGYISNEWPHLLHFLGNGLIALSNNKVENAIRPFAIGRKNWLFSYSTRGAQASAILYSLIATAKDHDLHVEDYLNDLFLKIPLLKKSSQPDYTPLLPWNWKQ